MNIIQRILILSLIFAGAQSKLEAMRRRPDTSQQRSSGDVPQILRLPPTPTILLSPPHAMPLHDHIRFSDQPTADLNEDISASLLSSRPPQNLRSNNSELGERHNQDRELRMRPTSRPLNLANIIDTTTGRSMRAPHESKEMTAGQPGADLLPLHALPLRLRSKAREAQPVQHRSLSPDSKRCANRLACCMCCLRLLK
jgi:hypothetical protein